MPIKRRINTHHLPITREEMHEFGWDSVDVVIVTGDAYVDHPSFGFSLIARILARHGYRVAILPQPRHDTCEDFRRFGKPRLFFAISAGNLDSILSNYTSFARVRDNDSYSPDGNPYFDGIISRKTRRRPDRATIRYSHLAKEAYPDVVIIIGGLEASLRRFTHYDYQQDKIRASILEDSKANLLVYGLAEYTILEIARKLENKKDLSDIPGTCEIIYRIPDDQNALILPSYDEIISDKQNFLKAELLIESELKSKKPRIVIQKQKTRYIKQNIPPPLPDKKEFKSYYELPFQYTPHPSYNSVPAWNMIKGSITIVRGCPGNCAFCSITRHQGNIIQSRDEDDILRDVHSLVKKPFFDGVITDLGGPTANLYGVTCKINFLCNKKDCLYPKPCKNLILNDRFLQLLRQIRTIKGVKHVFISSGLRYDILPMQQDLLIDIINYHTPGRLKIAPECLSNKVLKLMHKPGTQTFSQFIKLIKQVERHLKKKIVIVPYIMSSYPSMTTEDILITISQLKSHGINHCSLQDFTPSPGTIATSMYFSEINPSNEKIYVPKKRSEKMNQRRLIEKNLKILY